MSHQVNADVYRCVKWVYRPEGKYATPGGKRMDVKSLPLMGKPDDQPYE